MAVIAGTAENIFGKKDNTGVLPPDGPGACSCEGDCSENSNAGARYGIAGKVAGGMRYAFVELLGDISKWLIAGIIIAGVISYFVPQNFIKYYLGSGWQAMLIMLERACRSTYARAPQPL